tara:strand:+ start:230 stop:643 length:414 start_codon:yes stop_codon:yes gene_type:complete
MKITRRQLKRIIQEELSLLSESSVHNEIFPGEKLFGPKDIPWWQRAFATFAIHESPAKPGWRDTGDKAVKLAWDTISSKLDQSGLEDVKFVVERYARTTESDRYSMVQETLNEKVGVAALQELGRKIDDLVEEERDA